MQRPYQSSMSEASAKRQHFVRQIRQRQKNRLFREVRLEHEKLQKQEQYYEQIDKIFYQELLRETQQQRIREQYEKQQEEYYNMLYEAYQQQLQRAQHQPMDSEDTSTGNFGDLADYYQRIGN